MQNLSSVFAAVNALFDAVGELAPGRQQMAQWCSDLVALCEKRLSVIVFSEPTDGLNHTQLCGT